MLQLLLGGSGSGKTTLLYQRIRARAEKGEKSILLVPEQFTSSTEGRIYRELGDALSGMVESFSFTSLAEKILSDAAAGFTAQTQTHRLRVECPPELWESVPAAERDGLRGVLENDPRPSYQHDPERVYGMEFSGLEVHFVVDGAVLTVTGITRR